MGEYAWQTPYAYFKNSPIAVLDIAGMGGPYEEDGGNTSQVEDVVKGLVPTYDATNGCVGDAKNINVGWHPPMVLPSIRNIENVACNVQTSSSPDISSSNSTTLNKNISVTDLIVIYDPKRILEYNKNNIIADVQSEAYNIFKGSGIVKFKSGFKMNGTGSSGSVTEYTLNYSIQTQITCIYVTDIKKIPQNAFVAVIKASTGVACNGHSVGCFPEGGVCTVAGKFTKNSLALANVILHEWAHDCGLDDIYTTSNPACNNLMGKACGDFSHQKLDGFQIDKYAIDRLVFKEMLAKWGQRDNGVLTTSAKDRAHKYE
jgi:hypothetical protein